MRSLLIVVILLSFPVVFLAAGKPGLADSYEKEDGSYLGLQREVMEMQVGDTPVYIKLYGDRADNIFLSVHGNERTSIKSTLAFIASNGGYFVELTAQNRREIRFDLEGNEYAFDPNRIFSDVGIEATLRRYGRYSENAHQEVANFVESLLKVVIQSGLLTVVTVHNNTNSRYSIRSYLKGGSEEKNAEDVHVNNDLDPDDFFYVITGKQFNFFKDKGYNVVLQSRSTVVDDGSLSVFCGVKGIDYINVEAEHGHLKEQGRMLEVVSEFLESS